MTKEDVVWIVIKTIGICLLVLALMNLKGLVHSQYMANKSNSFMSNDYFVYKEATKEYFVEVVFYMLMGLYMTCKGKLLYRIACSPLKKEDEEET